MILALETFSPLSLVSLLVQRFHYPTQPVRLRDKEDSLNPPTKLNDLAQRYRKDIMPLLWGAANSSLCFYRPIAHFHNSNSIITMNINVRELSFIDHNTTFSG